MTRSSSRAPGSTAPAAAGTAPGLLRGLLDAQRMITADLSVQTMPARILEAACTLLDAAFGGYVVLGRRGEVIDCVHHDLPEQSAARLAATIGTAGTTLERTLGLRAHGFVSAAVRVRGDVVGELHLARPVDALRALEAEELLEVLAAMAGTALETATLHGESQRSRDWLHASGEIARTMLSGGDADTLMEVVSRALHVAEADAAALILPTEDGRLRIAVAAGLGGADFRGRVIDATESALGRAVTRGESLLVNDMGEVMRDGYQNVHDYGPVMNAPLVDMRGIRGAVVFCRARGRLPFSAGDLDLATTFADQVALALEMDDARSDGEWLSVVEDRHRIAQDLHDNVMQRLFATGVGLQSLAAGPLAPELGKRLGRYIADLDETIDEIRDRVFGLRDGVGGRAARTQSRFPRLRPDEQPASGPISTGG